MSSLMTTTQTVMHLSHLSYALSKKVSESNQQAFCIVLANNAQVTQAYNEMSLFLNAQDRQRLLVLPDWETLPYDAINAHRHITARRMQTLYQLTQSNAPILLTSTTAYLQTTVPRSFITRECFLCQVGQTMHIEQFREQMIAKGYDEVPEVSETGQFAIRGSILDVILDENNILGYRIELFDNEVDSIRILDVQTNRSHKKINAINILPSREYNSKNCNFFDNNRNLCPEHLQSELKSLLKQPHQISGIEYYLPFLHEQMETIDHYLDKDHSLITPNHFASDCEIILTQAKAAEKKQTNQHRPIAHLNALYREPNPSKMALLDYHIDSETQAESCLPLPNLSLNKAETSIHEPLQQLRQKLNHVTLYAQNKSRCENLYHALHCQSTPCVLEDSQEKLTTNKQINIRIGNLKTGFICSIDQHAHISENDLIGRVINQHSPANKRRIQIEDHVENWEIGTLIVHRDYGIGKFLAFQTISRDDNSSDFLVLGFADDDKLYVATHQFHLLSRYVGPKTKQIILSKIGGKKWQNKKKKAMENADLLAEKLLEQHALRRSLQAKSIQVSEQDMALFTEHFPYTETPDQKKAIETILNDIKKPIAMNRLLCGDVGFGKTEVAMRAAFACAYSGCQVALLAPTTILAQQHYETFRDRFSHFPLKVSVLSRLATTQQQDIIKSELANGKVDIVIATHSLLRSDIQFAQLGLLIIDEEHKFGVKQKELIQAIGAKAHVLAMSATPIPRSLHMSLAKLRDMSIIATPPKNRQAITTFVEVYSDQIVKDAITREYQRGGQCYVIHNDIKSLEIIKENILSMLPQISCRIMHAKQPKAILEQTMLSFQKGEFDVLLATTIIESGIDIANANTIILQRADLLGLSQIHQLRGRVGRSHHQAYAYLLTPPLSNMTNEGIARIKTIKKQKQLGSGLNVALEDLEIRGAGDLLGKKQSGSAEEIGLTLYSEMLKKASQKRLGHKEQKSSIQVDIDLGLDTHIPKTYIRDFAKRLHFYRVISVCEDLRKLEDIKSALEDQYGMLPKTVVNAIMQRKLQIQCVQIGICKIATTDQHTALEVDDDKKMRAIVQKTNIHQWPIRIIGSTIRIMHNEKTIQWNKIFDSATQQEK